MMKAGTCLCGGNLPVSVWGSLTSSCCCPSDQVFVHVTVVRMFDDDDIDNVPLQAAVAALLPPTTSTKRRTAAETAMSQTSKSWTSLAQRLMAKAPWPKWLAGKAKPGVSWLVAGTSGLGCLVCQQQKEKLLTPWASGAFRRRHIKRAHLNRHAASKGHQAALAMFFGVETGPGGRLLLGAPPLEDFERLHDLMSRGRHTEYGAASSTKTALMMWCIGETLAEADRKFLARCKSISLVRDARKSLLLIRWSGCTAALETRTGILGISRNDGDSAGQIVSATRKIMEEFCTLRLDPPRFYRGAAPVFDEELFKHIRGHIEMITTDAASNELLASEVGRGCRNPDLEEPRPGAHSSGNLTPNLLVVGRDHAHAFRRCRLFVLFLSFYCLLINIHPGSSRDPMQLTNACAM
jgi:hypothetical protein